MPKRSALAATAGNGGKRAMMCRVTFAAALVLVAGCAAEPVPTATPKAASSTKASDNAHRIQSIVGDCMKKKGFRYVPWVPPVKTSKSVNDRAYLGDYAAMKQEREKRGFTVFYRYAHPDQKEEVLWSAEDSPNSAIIQDLSPAQLAAYEKQRTACKSRAIKEVTGKVVKDENDLYAQEDATVEKVLDRELNGDPKLVELAAQMGACLKGKGYSVADTRPSTLHTWGWRMFEDKVKALAKNDDKPEDEEMAKHGQYTMPVISVADGKRYFSQEVRVALDDLACGKDFYAAYSPRNAEIQQRVALEFGGGDY
ncbi:hypothetical protein ACFWY5_37730 [Nonomuraea sp. NPDC059007]|uniref:hypothetical protein n=1 Tax=Nonomuraea sp. NPDC059007 TaxID=3346692 RepID=UPI0036A5087F